MALKTILYFL